MRFLTRLWQRLGTERAPGRGRPGMRYWPGRPAPRFRPCLEALEDRCLLSAGALDPTFGSGGVVTTSVGPATLWNGAQAVAIDPNDGKIVAAGRGAFPRGGSDFFAVVRYTSTGTLDSSFGSGGEVITNFDNKPGLAYSVAIQSDGKIVAAGYTMQPHGGDEFVLVRYNAINGSLDTTFGSGKSAGTVLVTGVSADSIALQADGKIVVAGASSGGLTLLRYNANGSLDKSFNGSGEILSGLSVVGLVDVAIYPPSSPANAGKIVVVGQTGGSVAVFRYNPDGSPDSNFGGGTGSVFLSTSVLSSTPHVAIQADDRLDVAFTNGGSVTSEVSVARLQANGALDPGFGAGGVVTTNHQMWDQASSIALQADGKIVVAGEEPGTGFVVARFNATDGSLDTSFGVNGFQTVPDPTYHGNAVGLAIQPDGGIVIAGTRDNSMGPLPPDFAFVVARFLPSDPEIGSFTANQAMAGGPVTLTASHITDANPGSTVTQVAFFYYDSLGNKVALETVVTPDGSGNWTLSVSLPPGAYTLYAQAEDSYGVLGDPFAIAVTLN